jgi:hypothetical protein
MKALIAVETMFGNTEKVAWAIAEGFAKGADVEVIPACGLTAERLHGIDLLIAGGPTHGHGMARRESREGAMKMIDHATSDIEIGLRERLDELEDGKGLLAAAFDTRLPQPKILTGSAADVIARRLARHGYKLAARPASFIVEHSQGPLRDGELERAKAYGESLLAAAKNGRRVA